MPRYDKSANFRSFAPRSKFCDFLTLTEVSTIFFLSVFSLFFGHHFFQSCTNAFRLALHKSALLVSQAEEHTLPSRKSSSSTPPSIVSPKIWTSILRITAAIVVPLITLHFSILFRLSYSKTIDAANVN